MELSNYIAELLHKHNCVIVPDFGGFIANYKSAVIDDSKSRITPPSKSVLFNPKLTNNDGLLGNKIAEARIISYQEANAFIADNVTTWKKDLAAGARIEIGEIGFLFQQKNQIIFEQNREFNLLLNAYGLSGVSFVNFATPPVEQEKPVEEKVATESIPVALKVETETTKPVEEVETPVIALTAEKPIEENTIEESDQKVIPIERKPRKVWKYIAVAAAIPLLFYSYWIPMETDFIDTGKIQIADFNPIQKSPERTYKMRLSDFESPVIPETVSWETLTEHLSDNVQIYNYQFDNELYIPIRLDKTATELPSTEAAQSAPETYSANEDLKYHVIGGCFSVKSNAENLVADLNSQGYSASVLDYNKGLYRVSVGDFANRAEAKSSLKSYKNEGNSGWILKK